MTPAEVVAPLPLLRGLALRLVGANDADGLMQDTAERAIRHCGKAEAAHLRGWLATIMTRCGLERRRKAAYRRRLLDQHWHPRTEAEPDAEHVVLLREVWTYVSPRERAVVAHHLEHEGWLSNTDKSQIRRVRRRLRAALGEGA